MITDYKKRLTACLVVVSGLLLSIILMVYITGCSTSISSDYVSAVASKSSNASDIISLIRRNYNPPSAPRGSVQRSTITITVNRNGDVLQVSALGADEAVNNAAKQAVIKTGNLPINSSSPLYPTFSINFHGTTD